MLTEYALTPHLFDDQHNDDDPEWLERLRAFGERLFPTDPTRVFNAVLSDLCDGSWLASGFLPIIRDLENRQKQDPANNLPALGLLKTLQPRVERYVVRRPFTGDDLPDTEEQWANEALASSRGSGVPIHRVVASSRLPQSANWYLLHQTREEKFWDCVPLTQNPNADVQQQLNAFCRVLTLYPFLALASPHLNAQGAGKDLTFAIELIKAAFNRPAGFPSLTQIDLHTEGPFRPPERQPFVTQVFTRLRQEIGAQTAAVRLFLWPRLLERRLLAGHPTAGRKPEVVWAFSLTHVARPDIDGPDQEPPTFAVLSSKQISRIASRYYGSTGQQPYAGSPFTG